MSIFLLMLIFPSWKDYKNVIDSNEKTSIMEREQQFKQMYSSEDVSKVRTAYL